MNIFHILYLLGAGAAIIAGFPQLRRLFLAKQSDEFSIPTWFVWMFAQVTALGYAISMRDMIYASVALFWIGFYAVMLTLIVKYRGNGRPAEGPALAE